MALFNCVSFYKFSRQLSAFSLCSSGLISAVLVLSNISLYESLPQPWCNPLWLTGLKAWSTQLSLSLSLFLSPAPSLPCMSLFSLCGCLLPRSVSEHACSVCACMHTCVVSVHQCGGWVCTHACSVFVCVGFVCLVWWIKMKWGNRFVKVYIPLSNPPLMAFSGQLTSAVACTTFLCWFVSQCRMHPEWCTLKTGYDTFYSGQC